jgi:hypothetical protein
MGPGTRRDGVNVRELFSTFRRNFRTVSSTAAVMYLVGAPNRALAQTSSSDEAVQLLSLTLACPFEAQTGKQPAVRTITTSRYLGDGKTFKTSIIRHNRTHHLINNMVVVVEDVQTYEAKFRNIGTPPL